MITEESLRKLCILGGAAKFDVSCASSGVSRAGSGKAGTLGNSISAGICHSFTEDGRCVSLLKVLLSNECIFDCKYCANRRSNDIERTHFTPEELAEITVEFYRRNYIEGLFLSSAVPVSPDETMLELCRTMYLLRFHYGFYGYIHCKSIPGCDPVLTELAGRLADRISANIELPSEKSLHTLAPQKRKESILGAFQYIHGRIEEDKQGLAPGSTYLAGGTGNVGRARYMGGTNGIVASGATGGREIRRESIIPPALQRLFPALRPSGMAPSYGTGSSRARTFAPGGQSTQMIVGATPDDDRSILTLSEALYRRMRMKRVYYSAYIPINEDPALPSKDTPTPLLREHRLYQADWLLRFYRFRADELLDAQNPHLDLAFDPKCNWALRHLEYFPVDINRCDYDTLLRVPGIGVKSAQRIVEGRRLGNLTFEDLKKIGVVLKRAQFFITCSGRSLLSGMRGDYAPDFIRAHLSMDIRYATLDPQYYRLSLFDTAAYKEAAGD